jgi:uncharacterized metal-binding protein YceD (DUF177 family)
MEKSDLPWGARVVVDDIPDTGLHVELEAPAAVRDEIARVAGLRALPRFSAVFDLIRDGDGAQVLGQVSAQVGQNCVVTLEPIETDIDEPVDLTFAPAAEKAAKVPKADDDAPEPLIAGAVDLAAVATEFLLLGIDPYPRKPGAEFSPPKAEDDGAHPFAALEVLKKRPGGEQP